MQRGNLDDLSAFLIVAREGSFTKAAAKLGISQSTLSYTIKELETRLKLRLLTRTTRSVSPTAAGERLLRNVGPRLEEIEAELAALGELREQLRQSASADPWRVVRLGIRKGFAGAQGAGGRPIVLQHHDPDARCGARGSRPGLFAGSPSAALHQQGSPQAGARGLVPALSRLPP